MFLKERKKSILRLKKTKNSVEIIFLRNVDTYFNLSKQKCFLEIFYAQTVSLDQTYVRKIKKKQQLF